MKNFYSFFAGIALMVLGSCTIVSCSQRDYLKEVDESVNNLSARWESVLGDSGLNESEKAESLESIEAELRESVLPIIKEGLAAHKDDSVAVELVCRLYYMELEGPENLLADIEALGPVCRQHPDIVKLHDMLSKEMGSAVGNPFIDFSAKNVKGATVKLSDYAGKGKWCLVDFWASWCGPCRMEMANLRNIYKEFAPKGLVMVSVAVWDKEADSIAAAKDLDMDWGLMVGAGEVPTALYCISGIPHIILIDPDGIISSRGLRGEALYREIEEKL